MDKLIELLDLYRRENKTEELFGEPGTLVPLTGKDFIILNRVMIISKEYGFIKWLVDNDKIDREGMKGHGRLISYCLYIKSWQWDKIKEGVLLMLLAISDKPIYDLISYLK